MEKEQRQLLRKLKREYGKSPTDITKARGTSKNASAFFDSFERIIANSFILRLKNGEKLTFAEWEDTKSHIWEFVTTIFYG